MKFAQDIILTPVITERSMDIMRNQRKYTFKVAVDANKIEIKNAVEELYEGKEKRVRYKAGKTASYKKAIVTLTEDSKTIEFFDNLM